MRTHAFKTRQEIEPQLGDKKPKKPDIPVTLTIQVQSQLLRYSAKWAHCFRPNSSLVSSRSKNALFLNI